MNILQAREEKGRRKGIKLGKQAGLKLGKQEGKKEGVELGRIETALEMLKDNLPIARIAQYTNLSKKKIEKLKSSHDKGSDSIN